MVCNIITADKANRLFWLGRYAERVYISLHLLRRYYDRVLDGDIQDMKEYYRNLDIDCSGDDEDGREFQISQLYDQYNICSIYKSIERANDNGVVLRHDITSESLSYIQMSQVLIKSCAEANESNISKLQPITDYMLAFFGSIDERLFDKRIKRFLKLGRLVENIDLHIRFSYPYFRVEEVYLTMKELLTNGDDMPDIDMEVMAKLDGLMSEEMYEQAEVSYRRDLLHCLNSLMII